MFLLVSIILAAILYNPIFLGIALIAILIHIIIISKKSENNKKTTLKSLIKEVLIVSKNAPKDAKYNIFVYPDHYLVGVKETNVIRINGIKNIWIALFRMKLNAIFLDELYNEDYNIYFGMKGYDKNGERFL